MNKAYLEERPKTPGIFGWTTLGVSPADDPSINAMRDGLKTACAFETQQLPGCAVGSTGQTTSRDDRYVAAVIGAPYWPDGDLWAIDREDGPAAALIRAYQKHGTDFIDTLRGHFAFAVIDTRAQEVLLAIDSLGHYPLYYSLRDGQFVFGSTAGSVLAHPAVHRTYSNQSIYNYIYFHMVPSPGAIYQDVAKLQGGTFVHAKTSSCHARRYFLPHFDEVQTKPFSTLRNELRHTLTKAVKRSMDNKLRVGSFLSGGLDSSTVTGILSEITEGIAEAFSIGFDAKGYDEIAFARTTARHFGVKLHEYYVTPEDVVSALPLVATSYDEPFGNSSALPAWFCARFAANEGIQRLLAGDGGDELFAGNERYARQNIFEWYQRIPPLLREQLLSPAIRALPDRIRLFQKARSYVAQASIPLPDRLQSYNYLHRHPPSEVFSPDFLSQIDTQQPLALMGEVYNAPDEASTLNRMLFLDWQFTLADNDLRKVSHMCAMAGVDVRYPMLDHDLVAFSCRIPDRLKLKGQNLRYFYKRALNGWLPDETIKKKKQGFGLPFGVWMERYEPLRELANDSLLSFKKRNIINTAFLDKLVDLHRNHHAHYYGELIWVLVVLELWFASKDGYRPATSTLNKLEKNDGN